MAIQKDLNVPPYFMDFNEDDQYYATLYRPRMPVQGRELNATQFMVQNQIERFGNHVFKDGSIVNGVGILYYPNTHYISLEDNFNIDANSSVTDYDNTYLITNSTDSNNAVRAVIKVGKDGVKTNHPETNRVYLDYISTGTDLSNNDVNQFAESDVLYFYNGNQSKFGTLDANNLVNSINTISSNGSFTSNGYAYLIGCTEGVIYQKGYFLKVDKGTITVRDFTTNVTGYVVGFNTEESTVDENQDTNLVDNALGYPNENSPGAHRLKLVPELISKARTDIANNTQFFAIVEFDGQQPTQQNDRAQYNEIEKHLSLKTYEESGDYVVNPFQIETRVSANSQTFNYEISPGIAYVRGYRIEKIGTTKVEVPRATTTDIAQNQIVTANYGNYVMCDEFLGQCDFDQLSEVTLYNEAQNAVSDYEGVTSIPSGSAVGYANIRAVVFSEGTKGLPTAKYFVYLYNIRMNSGKNFSTDVKSIYSDGTYGKTKADIVLENGLAVIKESNKNFAYFNTGLSAVKRLTNNTGVGDTSFIYNQIKSGTLSTNGSVTITINTVYSGAASERLNSTSGSTLTGSLLEDYNVYLSANAYTANLTNDIAISSGNVVITGNNTLFSTELESNSNIRIYANTTQTYIRRVVSIASNTQLTIDTPLPFTNTSCQFQKYYVTGSCIPLQSVVINSNTSFTANVNLPAAIASGTQSVYCSYPVNRNEATAIPKVIRKSRYVKIDCSNNVANTIGPWDLGLSDIHKVRNVYVGTTYANTNPERFTWFALDNGQRDSLYDHGRLYIKPQYSEEITSLTKILVELDYFVANTTASAGFFSVESYPIDDANTANTTAIQTIEIPQYQNVDLRNVIDFRPIKHNSANGSATAIADATINPAVSNASFNVPASGQYFVAPDTNFTADFEYYLPRMDLITIDPNGIFDVKQGQPATKPKTPFVENDQTAVAEAFVPAYPTATKREYEIYGPNINSIRINLKTNRRYTMRDIGALEERLKRMEYYTVLNVLEQQARDLSIPDANGLDRFKNGIFADPFNSHNLGNVADFEYKIAIDKDETVARPFFEKHDVDFQYVAANSSGVQRSGPVITLEYDEVTAIGQQYATKIRNTTESLWQWNGMLDLYPSYDFYRDEKTAPNVNVNLDLSTPWERFAASGFGTIYGDWRDIGTSQTQSFSVTEGNQGAFDTITTSVATTTYTAQQQILNSIRVNTLTNNIDLGSYVKDITIQPYMRSRVVAFVAYNMKPNTTLHAFFDDVLVDAYCAPGSLVANSDHYIAAIGHEENVVQRTSNFGSALVSDANGFICGHFKIPEQTFRTGDRVFQLTNVDDLVVGENAKITASKTVFTADNVAVTKGSTTINVRQPSLSFQQTTANRVVAVTDYTSSTQQIPHVHNDPIAQSFSVEPPDIIPGVFITSVGVYFKAKDNSLGCTLYVCEMENNQPNMNRILGKSYLPSSNVNVSDTANTETKFVLDYPLYMMRNDYAFVVQPDGNSPEYLIWTAETGGYDVASDVQIYSNPYTGLMFISANRKTWTPYQKEDLKFKIYRANFTSTSGIASFKNENDEFLSVDGFTRANSSNGIEIGDIVYTVNSSANVGNVASIVSNTLTASISGRVQYFNETDGILWLDSSTANSVVFSNTTNKTIAIYRTQNQSNTSYINANTLVSYANIVSVDNLKYHAVVPKFGVIEPARTSLEFSFKGTSNSNVKDTAFKAISNEIDFQFIDNERHIMSKSNEMSDLSGNKSSEFNIALSTDNALVSPVINLSRKAMLFIENIINDDSTNEHTRYGNSLARYVSKKVVLADGQEAEDLKVYMTAYRPPDSDIEIYAKFWNNQDSEVFDDKVWTKLQYDNGSDYVYSSQTNTSDYIEYEFSVPSTNAVPYAAFANTGFDIYNALGGGVSIQASNVNITAKQHSFNANTQVNGTNETITITGANTYFSVGNPVIYNVSAGNTAVSGLTSGITYYVSFANSTVIALAETRTGANINITPSSISETGHYFTGTSFLSDFTVGDRIRVADGDYFAIRTVTNIANNTYMTVDNGLEQTNTAAIYYVFQQSPNDGIVEYTNAGNSRFIGFKEFAIKIVLLSSNPVSVPKINDLRCLALQV